MNCIPIFIKNKIVFSRDDSVVASEKHLLEIIQNLLEQVEINKGTQPKFHASWLRFKVNNAILIKSF
jgi:hypothetical protein